MWFIDPVETSSEKTVFSFARRSLTETNSWLMDGSACPLATLSVVGRRLAQTRAGPVPAASISVSQCVCQSCCTKDSFHLACSDRHAEFKQSNPVISDDL